MSGQLGELVISLQADIARFREDMGKATKISQDASKKIADGFDKVGAGVVKVTGLVAGFTGVAGVGALIKSSIDAADNLSKMSQKVGVNIEQLSSMNYAASLADVSTESLAKGMAKLNKAMYEAQQGGKTQVETFKALGIAVTDSSGKLRKTDDVMMDIAERFAGMDDGARKTALAMEVFGKAGADMIPLLNSGKQGLKDSADEAKRFGNVLTEEAGKQAEEFNDNLTRFNKSAGGLAMVLANDLIPVINELSLSMLSLINIDTGIGLKQQLRDWKDFHAGVDQIIRDMKIKAGSGNGVWNWLTKNGRAEINAELQASQALYDWQMQDNAAKLGNSVKAVKPLVPPKGDGGTTSTLEANAKAAAQAESAFQRYSSTFDALMTKADGLNPELSKNQKELLAINAEIEKAIKENPLYADSIKEAGDYLRKMTTEATALQNEIAAVTANIKELEAANASMAGIGTVGGLEPSSGFLTVSEPKPNKYSLNGASETMGFGGNTLSPVDDKQAEADELLAIEERYNKDLISMKMGAASQMADLAKQMAGDNKGIALAALAFQKGLAIAQIMISTQVAAMAALAPPPLGLGPIAGVALAAEIEAMGYVSMGLVAASGLVEAGNIAGARADGGPVSAGQTYLVGERGPELFTAGSSGMITPNNAIGGQTISPTNVFQISTGVAETVRAEIMRIVPTLNKMSVNSVKSAMRNGEFQGVKL